MSTHNDARDLVIKRLQSIIDETTMESYEYEADTEEAVRSLHTLSILYRLRDQV